eukprot:SAG22_NODE_1796_length_3550_cov_3.789047_2_plen_363_part_00
MISAVERPFVRPNSKTLGGDLPQLAAEHALGRGQQMPPWDNINLYGGQYVIGEEAQPEYVAKLSGASVDGGSGIVFDRKRIYRVDDCGDGELGEQMLEPEWPTVTHSKRLATVVHRFKGHYYHWFAEELPRLLLLEEYFASLPEDKRVHDLAVLVPAGAVEHFVSTTLHLLEIKWKVIVAEPGVRYTADELYVPTPVCDGRPSRESVERVRARLAPHMQSSQLPAAEGGGGGDSPPATQNRRIVVIKRLEAENDLENHDELENRLRFEFPDEELVIYDGTTHLGGTVETFSGTNLIIAPHGAGLVNMMFAPPGCVVVELMHRHRSNWKYWHLATALGLEHWTVFSEGTSFDDSLVVRQRSCF